MKGTMTIRGATIDLKDTQIAKVGDIETILRQLEAQPVTEQVAGIYTLLFKIIDQNRAVMALLNKELLWARIKRWTRRTIWQ